MDLHHTLYQPKATLSPNTHKVGRVPLCIFSCLGLKVEGFRFMVYLDPACPSVLGGSVRRFCGQAFPKSLRTSRIQVGSCLDKQYSGCNPPSTAAE